MKKFRKLNNNNPIIFTFTIIIFCLIIQSNFYNVTVGYWDQNNGGDCITEHGVGYLNATYFNKELDITLDGIDNELEWNNEDVQEIAIPTATVNNSKIFFISYIYLKIIYDNSYMYLRAFWNESSFGSLQDGISICWNINVENYSVAIFIDPYLMTTLNKNELVDNWKWSYANLPNQSTYKARDQGFGSDGWIDWKDEGQDVQTGYSSYLDIDDQDYYMVEFKRKLVTNDKYDVQFNHNGNYNVSFAILDDEGGEEHAVSWNWNVRFNDIQEKSVPASAFSFYLIIAFISSFYVFYIIKNNNLAKIKNE